MKTLKAIISILAIVIALILTGCEVKNVDTKQTQYVVKSGHRPLEVVVIDGCEYLYGPRADATVLTHKGNCPNHGSEKGEPVGEKGTGN